MGDSQQHRALALTNGQLAMELLQGDGQRLSGSARWAVIVAHYAAREWVHAWLAHAPGIARDRHPRTHPDTHTAFSRSLNPADPTVVGYLQSLYDLSRGARYIESGETTDSWYRASFPTPHAAATRAMQMADMIRHAVEAKLP